MSRSLRELIDDYETNPSQWDVVTTIATPSTNRRNLGGSSVQELFRHKVSGEELVRHTLLRSDGSIFGEPHFRPNWK